MATDIYKVILVLFCFSTAQFAKADGIIINNASSELVDDVYQLDAKLEFNLDAEVFEALEHGVSISIDLIILIKRERNWLWDPKIKEETLRFRLEQHPLSTRYLVSDLVNGNRRQFKSAGDALDYMGTIKNHFLISRTVLSEDENYVCMLKAELNTETLPPAIRPVAFVSKKWQLDSPWYSWSIKE